MGGPRGGQSINAPSIPAAEEEEKSVFGRNSLLNYPGAAEQTVPLLIRRISTISHFQTTQGEELPLVYHPRSVIRHPGVLLCSPQNIKHRSGFSPHRVSFTSVPPSFIAYAIVVNVDNLRMTFNFQCLTILYILPICPNFVHQIMSSGMTARCAMVPC